LVGALQRFVNGERTEGLAEVGLPHSREEAGEIRWIEGGNKSAFLWSATRVTQEVAEDVERELKGIRYQSRVYCKLETLMNRVNESSIKEEHLKQSQKKAVGVDGVTKLEYGERLEENVSDLIGRMKRFSYKPQPVRRAQQLLRCER